jgi:tetratricopeptide (TPR) repeat protein
VGARLADELNWFWGLRGYRREARERVERLLTLATGRTEGRARALSAAGWRAHGVGEYERAAALLEESIAIWRELGDKRGAAIALVRFGQLEQSRGDYDRAWTLLEESRGLFREIGGESGLDAPVAVFLAQVAKNRGDNERAIPLFEDCLTLARERGDTHAASSSLRSLGELRQVSGDYGRAAMHLKESLILVRELDDRPCTATTLDSLAVLATVRGEPARALRMFAAAEIAREVEVYTLPPADRDRLTQAVAAARTQLDPAAIDAAWAEGRAMTLEQAITYALEGPAPT